jgi:hypothetical protein
MQASHVSAMLITRSITALQKNNQTLPSTTCRKAIFISSTSVTPYAREKVYRKQNFFRLSIFLNIFKHLTHLKNGTIYIPLFPQITQDTTRFQ